ncbi:MAG: putative phosphodiesterase [Verrucomicrobiales bacterium]|jgi:predicted phosphodiesterase
MTIENDASVHFSDVSDAGERGKSANEKVRPPAGPIRVLSDLHLGHSGTLIDDVAQLTPLIDGAGTIIFNGDTVEERCSEFYHKGQDMLGELDALCRHLGAQPVYLSGNHDPDSWERSWIDLCGGDVFVSHGHAILKYISPWSRNAGRTGQKIDALWEKFDASSGGTIEERFELTRQSCQATEVYQPQLGRSLIAKALTVAEEAWPPSRPLSVIRTWINVPEDAREFADLYRPNARFFIMGHTHFPGIWRAGNLNVINTGAFFLLLNARVVEISGDQMSVHKVKKNRAGEFVTGVRKGSFRGLPRSASV